MGPHGEGETGAEVAAGEDLHQVARRRLDEAGTGEAIGGDVPALGEAPGEVADVDDGELLPEGVLEAALRDAPVEWHLATLEAGPLAPAGTGFLPLVPPRRRLAVTRAGAATDALPLLPRPSRGSELSELHADVSSTRTA